MKLMFELLEDMKRNGFTEEEIKEVLASMLRRQENELNG